MKILVTGNMGYVGPVVCRYLRNKYDNLYLCGYDTGYFAHSLTAASVLPESILNEQRFGDMRDFPFDLLNDVDAVVHLAAISNDPMGNKFEDVTLDINRTCTVSLAEEAAKRRVKSFVFASSCSMYGAASSSARTEYDSTNPLTAYAKSKIGSEDAISSLDLHDMTVTSLRFATACGMSPRLRLDLVLNDLVASALFLKKIVVLSDGTPWRPLIDVEDMARAIDWAIHRRDDGQDQFLAVNAGLNENNVQIKDLAHQVSSLIGDVEVSINKDAAKDDRSYQVDFSKFASLAPNHTPRISIEQSILRLQRGMIDLNIHSDFREKGWMRLKELQKLQNLKLIDENLRWLEYR